jgi:hypothetical protein
MEDATPGVLSFMQISDINIGFNKEPNPKVTIPASLSRQINAMPQRPPLCSTGDLSHLSKPENTTCW